MNVSTYDKTCFDYLLVWLGNNLLNNMKAIVINQFGGPEACEFVENLPVPEPNDNQVIIHWVVQIIRPD